MACDSKLSEFVEKALAEKIPLESLVGVLTAHGWPEKEVYETLAGHYRTVTGLDIPRRAGAGASAKEAFFYLLVFSTLATWTIGLGGLAFSLIDRLLPDPLFFSRFQQDFDSSSFASSLAALIIAFPLYLLISRNVVRDAAAHPEKLDSSVRKWLTYMALVIAASVFVADLISALAHLLSGEITSRFVSKAFVVLVLSGGVFYYYFGGLRRTANTSSLQGVDRLMAGVSSVLVVLMVILGFWQLGSPSTQRTYRADAQRVNNLYELSTTVDRYWSSHTPNELPTIAQVPISDYRDPLTGAPYEYRPKEGSVYEMCANFARRSELRPSRAVVDPWAHPVGHYCFSLDASSPPQMPSRQPTYY